MKCMLSPSSAATGGYVHAVVRCRSAACPCCCDFAVRTVACLHPTRLVLASKPSAASVLPTCCALPSQGCVFTQDVNQAIIISDAMETGTVQVNAAPARGPDHFPFQGFRDSGIGTQVRRCHLSRVPSIGALPCHWQKRMHDGCGLVSTCPLCGTSKSIAVHAAQGVRGSLQMMVKVKSTVINLPTATYTQG